MNLPINQIMNGDALTHLKELADNSINCVMTSPPYWALRDYGSSVESIWDGDKDCVHEWIIGKAAGDIRFRTSESTIVGNNKNPDIWIRPSREEYATRDVLNICPVCNNQFEGKPNQKFCSIKCLNTLSNEQRQNTSQVSNFCLKCNAWKGQLGLEPTFDLFIKHLCDIFDEVKRVLRKDGTCWVNLGDTYASTPSGLSNEKAEEWNKKGDGLFNRLHRRNTNDMTSETTWKPTKYEDIKEKNLCNIPARFSIEMQNRGWILRNVIIWHKPNCMPSSIKDRFTVDFEYLFFFVKNKNYWFETQRESLAETSLKDKRKDKGRFEYNGKRANQDIKIQNAMCGINSIGRIKRTVWSIPPKPFKESHFATYPEELCQTPIKAGCPKDGIVLDPFFGAGTTGLVALKQGKKFIGIELNPEYIKIAKERLKPFLEQQKLVLP